jgi:Tfp pilus assembly protein PilN
VRAVNLLPGARRARGRPRIALPGRGAAARLGAAACLVAALGAIALVGWAGYDARAQVERLDGEIASAEQRRILLSAELEDFRADAGRAELQRARRGAVVSLVTGRTDWERLVCDVATVMPEGVWLTSLSTGSASTAPPPAGGEVPADTPAPGAAAAPTLTLEGIGPDQRTAAATLARLGAVSGLSDPRLVSSAFQDINGDRMVAFSIEATVDQRAQGRSEMAPVGVGMRP